jgi:hypothetical protein
MDGRVIGRGRHAELSRLGYEGGGLGDVRSPAGAGQAVAALVELPLAAEQVPQLAPQNAAQEQLVRVVPGTQVLGGEIV